MAPGQLTLAGLLVDLGTHRGHRLLDLDAGLGDVVDQRAGERAVVALLAVERGLAGAGRERDQRAFAGLHLGKTALHVDAAGRRVRLDLGGERIVAAGVEEDELDLGIAHGLVERQVDVDGRAQLDVHLRLDVGVDGQQVIGAADGDAVAGIIEQRDVGALRLAAEVEQFLRHLVAAEIGSFDHLEADIAQRGRHRLGVDRRVRQLRDVLVGAVADDEGNAAVSLRGIDRQRHAHQRCEEGEIAHSEIPRIELQAATNWQRTYTKCPTWCHRNGSP